MTRSSSRRGPWLPDEDQTLLDLVHKQGPNNWVRISQHMQHRTPKQCRERFHQNLKPSLNHDPISHQEGELIEQMVNEMGKRWAEIARRLRNRSDNAVKNWWNGSMNRRKRSGNQRGPGFKNMGQRNQPIPATYPPRSACPDQVLQQDVHLPTQHGPPAWPDLPQSRAIINTPLMNYPDVPTTGLGYQLYDPRLLDADRDRNSPYGTTTTPVVGSFPRPPLLSHQSHLEHLPLPHSLPRPHFQVPQTLYLSAGHAGEMPLISPMGSEASYAPSIGNPPSLVSDRHSTYSISPKTVPSPRPTMLAPIDTRTQAWREQAPQRRGSLPIAHSRPTDRPLPPDEGYMSAITPSTGIDGKHYQQMPGYDYGRPRSQNAFRAYHDRPLHSEQTSADLSPTGARDSRMHLSSLLH